MASVRVPSCARAWSRAPWVVAVAIAGPPGDPVTAADVSVARQKLGGGGVAVVSRVLPLGFRSLTASVAANAVPSSRRAQRDRRTASCARIERMGTGDGRRVGRPRAAQRPDSGLSPRDELLAA